MVRCLKEKDGKKYNFSPAGRRALQTACDNTGLVTATFALERADVAYIIATPGVSSAGQTDLNSESTLRNGQSWARITFDY